MTLTLTLLRRLPRHERPHRLDFLGAGLIMSASVVVHAGAQHGRRALSVDLGADPGAVRRWRSCSASAFIVRLRTAPEPLIPLAILATARRGFRC